MNKLDIVDEYHDQLKLFAYSLTIWFIVFGVLNDRIKINGYTNKKRVDIFNRIVSLLHG